MQNSDIEHDQTAAKRIIPLRGIASTYLKNIKTAITNSRGLFSATAVVATALVVATVASSGATVADNQIDVEPAQKEQPLAPAVPESPAINIQSQIESSTSVSAEPKTEPSISNRVTVSAEGETIKNNGDEATRQTISNSTGTTRVDININSSDQESTTSSHTRIKSQTSSSSGSDINIKSEVKMSN